MIIEMFTLKDKQKTPESVMVMLTPETLAEEDSLRNAKILHKNEISLVSWGDTLELKKPTGCKGDKGREDKFLGFSGLRINFRLPKEIKVDVKAEEGVVGKCSRCGKPLDKFESNVCTECLT